VVLYSQFTGGVGEMFFLVVMNQAMATAIVFFVFFFSRHRHGWSPFVNNNRQMRFKNGLDIFLELR
jgi:hypothetical protein